MLSRGLLTIAVAVAAVALVFQSVPAALAAGVIVIFSGVAKGIGA